MTGNVDRQATPHVSTAEYRQLVQLDLDGGTAPTRQATGGPRRQPKPAAAKRPAKRSANLPAKPAKKRTPAERKRAQRGVSPGLVPAATSTRGPWTVVVDWLGRPMTINDERASAMSKGTMAAVREDKRRWQDGFVEAIRHLGVPEMDRAFLVIQTYYPTNVVPDPDAFGPSTKAAIDALVTAGVLPNDRRSNLPFGYLPLPPVTDGGPPRIAFTIFPLP